MSVHKIAEKLILSLTKAVEMEVSDIYFRENQPIGFKDAAGIVLFPTPITRDDFKEAIKFLLDDADKFEQCFKDVDNGKRYLFGTTINGIGASEEGVRVRCQLVRDEKGYFLTVRVFLNKYIDYSDLTMWSKIGPKLENIFQIKQGLIIIIGGTGQGKSTLVSSYLEKIIKEGSFKFLKTIEDPIEHIFEETKVEKPSRGCLVSQMEIGNHIGTYEDAILSCTRDNSDIVYIQEIASKESAIALKKVMNSGKLVIITLHAAKVTQAIGRLLVLMREFDGDDSFNRKLLAQESICIIGQNLISGYDLDSNGKRRKSSSGTPILRKYGVQEFLNIGPTERNFIVDDDVSSDHERSLTKSLNDPSKNNVALNDVLVKFYIEGRIDSRTLISKSNDILNLKSKIENEIYNEIKHIEDFKFIEDFLLDKKIRK